MAMLQCFLGFEITDPKVDSSLELRRIDLSWLCDWSRKGPPSFPALQGRSVALL